MWPQFWDEEGEYISTPSQAYFEGQDAYLSGYSLLDCDYETNTPHWRRWRAGWVSMKRLYESEENYDQYE